MFCIHVKLPLPPGNNSIAVNKYIIIIIIIIIIYTALHMVTYVQWNVRRGEGMTSRLVIRHVSEEFAFVFVPFDRIQVTALQIVFAGQSHWEKDVSRGWYIQTHHPQAPNTYTEEIQKILSVSGSCGSDFLPAAGKFLIFKSDVWLTVHRNSMWIRKTN